MGLFDFFKVKSAEQIAQEEREQKEKLRQHREHFEITVKELGQNKLERMTLSEFETILNGNSKSITYNTRSIIAYASRYKLKLKDSDYSLSYEDRQKERDIERQYGDKKPNIICQHCQTKGFVRVKKGLKAVKTQTTGLGPLNSVLLPKSETKFDVTYFRCENCDMDWEVK